MLLRNRKEILCLLSTIVGILVLADEASHVLFQPGFGKCLVECYRTGQKDPRRQVSDPQNCSERCKNRSKEDPMDVVLKNTSSSIAGQSLTLPSRQRKRKGLSRVSGCPSSSGERDWYPTTVNGTFYQNANLSFWYLNVSWTPLNESSGNWTGILVRFMTSFDFSTSRVGPSRCIELPKNLTSVTINISSYGWKYPGRVFVKVCALPYHQQGVHMLTFSPVNESPTTTATKTNTEDPTTTAQTCKRLNDTDGVVWYPQDITVNFSNQTGDWLINISWTPFTEPEVSWTGYAIFILLSILPGGFKDDVPCIALLKNQTFFVVDSSLGWHYPDPIWINITKLPHSFRGYTEAMTQYDPGIDPGPGDDSVPEDTSSTTAPGPTESRFLVRILLPGIGAFVFVLLVVALTVYCHRKRRLVSQEEAPSTLRFKYHAFILYSSADYEWVEGNFIRTLEEKYGLKCCIHYRNFVPGTVYTDSMVESVYNSFKNIAVTSVNFFSSPNCNFELNYALSRLSNQDDDSLIVIKLDESVDSRLPRELVNRSYIDFTRTVERETWETKLVGILKEAVLEQSSEDENYFTTNNNNNNTTTSSSSSNEVLISTEDVDTIL